LEAHLLEGFAYGPTQILKAVNLAVKERGNATLLGANGAGKTTMLRAICNMMVLVSGRFGSPASESTARGPKISPVLALPICQTVAARSLI
jgi:ABC-type branched-subunit amino acid transport system ATPase component